jgi:F-type H+-transporting ATPase subunit b
MLRTLLLAAEGGGGGLTDVNLTLFVATLVLFALFALVLGKFAWGPLLEAIEGREKSVRGDVEGAQKANAEAQALLAQHKEMLKEAGREREELVARAKQDAEAFKNDLMTKARAEADQIVRRAKEQIEREKGQAIQELREKVADIAVEAASKIVKSSLTPEAQRKLVGDFIGSLPGVQ